MRRVNTNYRLFTTPCELELNVFPISVHCCHFVLCLFLQLCGIIRNGNCDGALVSRDYYKKRINYQIYSFISFFTQFLNLLCFLGSDFCKNINWKPAKSKRPGWSSIPLFITIFSTLFWPLFKYLFRLFSNNFSITFHQFGRYFTYFSICFSQIC